MARLHPLDPELRERARLADPTPLTDLQLQNLPREVEKKLGVPADEFDKLLDSLGLTAEELAAELREPPSYPRYDLMLEWWDE